MATKTKQEVAPAEDDAKLPVGLPEGIDMSELEADSGVGVTSMSADDIAVPYLYVLQSNSPQVNPDSDAYIEGARAGMFYNNVSGEVFEGREKGLIIIPCAYERSLVEWVHRDDGGGWVADHAVTSDILQKCKPDDKGKPRLPNGNIIVETAYHYVYLQHPETGQWEQVIIPTKSTMLKKSRRFNKTLMSTYIPGTSKVAPRWLYPYKLTTVKETKDTNTWSNIELVRMANPVTADQYRAAKAFAEAFSAGDVVRKAESSVGLSDDDGGSGGRVIDNEDEREEMPF